VPICQYYRRAFLAVKWLSMDRLTARYRTFGGPCFIAKNITRGRTFRWCAQDAAIVGPVAGISLILMHFLARRRSWVVWAHFANGFDFLRTVNSISLSWRLASSNLNFSSA
jgi:hypothetical protein